MTTKPKTGKTSPKKIQREIRQQYALELRKKGVSFRDIAKTLRKHLGDDIGVKKYSHVTAFRDVTGALRELKNKTLEKTDQLRTLQTIRLNTLLKSVWANALSGDDRSVETALKVMKQLDKLYGLEIDNLLIDPEGKNLIDVLVKEVIVEIPKSAKEVKDGGQ